MCLQVQRAHVPARIFPYFPVFPSRVADSYPLQINLLGNGIFPFREIGPQTALRDGSCTTTLPETKPLREDFLKRGTASLVPFSGYAQKQISKGFASFSGNSGKVETRFARRRTANTLKNLLKELTTRDYREGRRPLKEVYPLL